MAMYTVIRLYIRWRRRRKWFYCRLCQPNNKKYMYIAERGVYFKRVAFWYADICIIFLFTAAYLDACHPHVPFGVLRRNEKTRTAGQSNLLLSKIKTCHIQSLDVPPATTHIGVERAHMCWRIDSTKNLVRSVYFTKHTILNCKLSSRNMSTWCEQRCEAFPQPRPNTLLIIHLAVVVVRQLANHPPLKYPIRIHCLATHL